MRLSYEIPVETYATNVMGTINVMEAIRHTDSVRVGIMITTDKCYENKEQLWAIARTSLWEAMTHIPLPRERRR